MVGKRWGKDRVAKKRLEGGRNVQCERLFVTTLKFLDYQLQQATPRRTSLVDRP